MNLINKKTEAKIKAGEPWQFNLTIDNDVAVALLKDIKKQKYGAVVGPFINDQLRKALKVKTK